MFDTVPHAGIPARFAVTLAQFFPPSRVTCTSPSLVPAHSSPALSGDSAIANTTSPYSTPMLSGVSPPEICCRLRSLSVRSGLITCQLLPPSPTECHSPRGMSPPPPPPPPPPNPPSFEFDGPRDDGPSWRLPIT